MKMKHSVCLLVGIIVLSLVSCTSTLSSQDRELPPRPDTILSVRVEEDISYMEGRMLDIYSPDKGIGWPIVVLLHGGGVNSKSLAELGSGIASNGAIVFTPTWSAHPPQASNITKGWDEVACSMRFIQNYTDEKGMPRTRVIIVGHSAGGASGFVTLLAANELAGECPQDGKPIKADAFIGLDGAYNIHDHIPPSRLEDGDPDEWERINPYHYLDKPHFRDNVDIVLVTGSNEELKEEAEHFKAAVKKAGFPVNHTQLPELDHWGLASPYQEVLDIILDVLYPN